VTARLVYECDFHAAHHLEGYEGDCARLHGHTYRLEVEVEGCVDKQTGMVVDFKAIKHLVQKVVAPLDHHNLDTVDALGGCTTAENIAGVIAVQAAERLALLGRDDLRLTRVRLWETQACSVVLTFEGRASR